MLACSNMQVNDPASLPPDSRTPECQENTVCFQCINQTHRKGNSITYVETAVHYQKPAGIFNRTNPPCVQETRSDLGSQVHGGDEICMVYADQLLSIPVVEVQADQRKKKATFLYL